MNILTISICRLIFLVALNFAAFLSPALAEESAPIEVTATFVTSGNFCDKYSAVGKVRIEKSKTYYATDTGTVDMLAVNRTGKVEEGDIILIINSEIGQASKAKAESAYAAAKSTFERDYSLWSKKIVSKDVPDKSRLALDTAKVDLAIAQNNYQNTVIRAPFDGTIGAITVFEGKNVRAGDYLFTIIAGSDTAGDRIISVELPESLCGKLDRESQVFLTDTKGDKIAGNITALSDYLNDTGTVTANLAFPENTKIIHGSYTEVEIIYNKHIGLALPEKVVLKNNKGNFIYKIQQDNKIKQVYITLGARFDNLIEISAPDIKEGDMIVAEGLTKVHEGTNVRLIDSSAATKKVE